MDWSGIQHVAVIMPTWIGDICMATPALRMLRHRMPGGGTITAIVRPGKATIIDGLETVDHMLELEPSGLLGPWRCGRALAKSGADAVLILPGSFRSGVVARVSGIRHRIGYARDGRGWLLTHPVKQPDRSTPTPQIQWYAGLVDDGGGPPPPPGGGGGPRGRPMPYDSAAPASPLARPGHTGAELRPQRAAVTVR